jgi:heavy metal efflux system protein
VRQQLQQLQQEIAGQQQQFQLLLNTDTVYVPAAHPLKMTGFTMRGDSSALATHPYLQLLRQQQKVSRARTQVEKSRFLPDLLLGYTNQSIGGFQNVNGVEKSYTAADRFSSVHLGVGVPLFYGAQRARVEASKIQEQAALKSFQAGKITLATQLQKALEQYRLATETLAYFETSALPNAAAIIKTADQQFRGGEINYLEWVLLTNQAITLQTDYIDAVRTYNQSILELNTLTGNN